MVGGVPRFIMVKCRRERRGVVNSLLYLTSVGFEQGVVGERLASWANAR